MGDIRLSSNATLSIGGVPIVTGLSVSMTPTPPRPARVPEFLPSRDYTFTAKLQGRDSAALFQAFQPAETPPVTMRLPWGLLGPITFRAWVNGHSLAQGADGLRASFSALADEPELRREIGRAYQRCYTPAGRAAALDRASESKNHLVRGLASALRRGRYRGVRKARNAIRRLLHTARVLDAKRPPVQQTPPPPSATITR